MWKAFLVGIKSFFCISVRERHRLWVFVSEQDIRLAHRQALRVLKSLWFLDRCAVPLVYSGFLEGLACSTPSYTCPSIPSQEVVSATLCGIDVLAVVIKSMYFEANAVWTKGKADSPSKID